MTFNYIDFQDIAKNLITSYGSLWVIKKPTKTTYNPTTNTQTTTSTDEETVSGVRSNFSRYEVDETIVKKNDFKLTIGKPNLSVDTSCLVVKDNINYKIKSIKEIKPANDTITLILHLTI